MNAYEVKSLKSLGIEVGKLGCVMLTVEKIPVADWLPPEWAYHAMRPELAHVDGLNSGDHVTLLYGLLQNANAVRFAVDEVLTGWDCPEIELGAIDVFPSPFADEPYSCIVARVNDYEKKLWDAHTRLSLLPHINTFPEYKPHLTLGYVKSGRVDDAVQTLRPLVERRWLQVIGLDYGRED